MNTIQNVVVGDSDRPTEIQTVNRHNCCKKYDVDAIRKFYATEPMSLNRVCQEFHLCQPTVSKVLRGVRRYTKTEIYNPRIDENYFGVIDTERKAYFVGLIIADGNVFRYDTENSKPNSNHRGLTSITLDYHDEYLLEEFKNELRLNRIVAHDGRGAATISVSSNKIASDLEKIGIVPRKSFITRFPFEIDPKMYRHIVRGIFDGDGSIQAVHHVAGGDGRMRFRHYMEICGTHRLMDELTTVLADFRVTPKKARVLDAKNRLLSEFKLSNILTMYRFGTWMYERATIYMKRKKDKFDLFKEHYQISDGTTYSFQSRLIKLPPNDFPHFV